MLGTIFELIKYYTFALAFLRSDKASRFYFIILQFGVAAMAAARTRARLRF